MAKSTSSVTGVTGGVTPPGLMPQGFWGHGNGITGVTLFSQYIMGTSEILLAFLSVRYSVMRYTTRQEPIFTAPSGEGVVSWDLAPRSPSSAPRALGPDLSSLSPRPKNSDPSTTLDPLCRSPRSRRELHGSRDLHLLNLSDLSDSSLRTMERWSGRLG